MTSLSVHHTVLDTVIFDFDGTLAKLNIDFDQMRHAIHELILRYDLDPETLLHKFVLETITEAGTLLREHSLQKSQSFLDDAFRIIESIEVEAAIRGELFTGTKKLLTSLKEYSISAGIITRNCAKAVHTVFPDILSYCTVVICRDDVKHVKPHPEQITLALLKLGTKSDRALMIGDHPLDIETGHNAGTLAAGVLTGHFREKDFLKAGADLVLSQASDILNYRVA